MIRFLHGADFHLDSAFGALPPGQAAARRRESRELALRLADYVKEHGIDLVLLAGDLFDSASPFRETGEQLAAALGQMRARVFISPGNHDWYGPGSPWETVDWPENVYVFKENRLTAVEVPERNLVIRPGTAGEPAGGFHRPGRRKVSHRPAPWGAGRGGGAVRPHPPGRGGGQRPLLSGTGPRPQADGAPDTGADGLRLARLSGGPGVRRAGGERFLRGDDLRRRRGLPDLCALCPAPV